MSNNNETLHENCTFVCITEDVNNQTLEVTTLDSNTTTLDEAKEWIGENCARGHYSCNNFDKIIVIDTNGEVEQIYTRQPENYGSWSHWY